MKGLMIIFLVFFTTVATCSPFSIGEKPFEIDNQLSSLSTDALSFTHQIGPLFIDILIDLTVSKKLF
jgi:hypothetical protein